MDIREVARRAKVSTATVSRTNIRFAQFILPPLTTVQMSQAGLARLAFHALLTDVQRETPAAHGTEYVLQTSLILRESTAMAPGSAMRHQYKGDR